MGIFVVFISVRGFLLKNLTMINFVRQFKYESGSRSENGQSLIKDKKKKKSSGFCDCAGRIGWLWRVL